MKFIPIVPSHFILDTFLCSDTTLTLAHLLEPGNIHLKQCQLFKRKGGELWLDNSFYELKRNMTPEELSEKAKLCNADVIVLPDTPMGIVCEQELRYFVQRMKDLGVESRFMAVVYADHGDLQMDLEQFELLNNMPEIDIIAIPYSFQKEFEMRRPELLDMIEQRIEKINKPVHLFGCNSYENLLGPEKRDWIQSIDGTLPWKVGFANIKMPITDDQDPSRPEGYFDIVELTEEQVLDITQNMMHIAGICKNGN